MFFSKHWLLRSAAWLCVLSSISLLSPCLTWAWGLGVGGGVNQSWLVCVKQLSSWVRTNKQFPFLTTVCGPCCLPWYYCQSLWALTRVSYLPTFLPPSLCLSSWPSCCKHTGLFLVPGPTVFTPISGLSYTLLRLPEKLFCVCWFLLVSQVSDKCLCYWHGVFDHVIYIALASVYSLHQSGCCLTDLTSTFQWFYTKFISYSLC